MTLKALTQKQRILLALKRNADKGVDQTMFLAPHVCDGGKPITRVAARIMELRDEGFPIREGGWRNTCRVYVLDERKLDQLAAPRDERPDGTGTAPPAVGALFDPVLGAAPPRGAYDDVEAA